MRRDPARAAPALPKRTCALILLLQVVGASSSCGGARTADRAASSPGMEVRDASDHPRLGLVVREGDPFAGVAVAMAHDAGPTASVWFGALLSTRLEGVVDPQHGARPSQSGLSLAAPARTAAEAARFVNAVTSALSTPILQADIARIESRGRIPPLVTFRTAGEAEAAACSGELGEAAPRPAPRAEDLERLRIAIRSTNAVAFAAVGPRAIVEAAADALRSTTAWPASRELSDPWPARDVATASRGNVTAPTLVVALRVADATQVLSAAPILGGSSSLLKSHLAALDPPWTMNRVAAVERPRGACLRVDAHAGAAVKVRTGADVAALVLSEMERARSNRSSEALSRDRGVLAESDPRAAAEAAAWRALGGRLPGGEPRTLVDFATTFDDGDSAVFPALLGESRANRAQPSIEVRAATEAGQGELFLLLASPCATRAESSDSAGVSALAVRAIARALPEVDGVRLEPWVSNDGIGLVAHAARKDERESAGDQAERVASALGRAIGTTVLSETSTALARTAVTDELSAEIVPLWSVALEALSPRHPSLLDPRGTWQSVSEIPTHAIETARHALLRLPLRLALLETDVHEPVEQRARGALERFLRPERPTRTSCPESGAAASRPGEYYVTMTATSTGLARAIVAVDVPVTGGEVPPEAEATVRILNRPGGLLDRAVKVPGLATFAEASVLGGAARAALAVEITTDEQKLKEAAAQVRALMSRLQEGAATAGDVAASTRLGDGTEDAVDPRRRLVRLWTGRIEPRAPDLASLRAFHRQVFPADKHVVVLSRSRQ